LLAAIMVVCLGFLTFVIIRQGLSWYFIVAEVLIVGVLVMLFVLYRKVVKPIEIIGGGMDLLREQDFSSRLGYVGQKDADRIVDIFNKMMEQLKDERLHVREQNHFLDLLVKSSPMGVIIMDFDEKISVINPSASEMFALDDSALIGRRFIQLSQMETGEHQLIAAIAEINKGESVSVRTNDGNIFKCTRAYFLDRGFSHTFYLIEKMTQEVLRAEKKAYGQVIRMISHEVNNSMAGISSSLDTVNEMMDGLLRESSVDHAADIGDIRELLSISSDRCISLSNFITAFANVVKIPDPQLEKLSINDFITGRIRFFESVCSSKKIVLSTHLSDGLPKVNIDPVLMEQVVVNIVKNAAESIDDNGTITIETALGAGKVTMTVIDNGTGISSEVSEKLFTPFFSTKVNGQGIGLTVIRDILLKHGFQFSLSTAADGLTRFTILFSTDSVPYVR